MLSRPFVRIVPEMITVPKEAKNERTFGEAALSRCVSSGINLLILLDGLDEKFVDQVSLSVSSLANAT